MPEMAFEHIERIDISKRLVRRDVGEILATGDALANRFGARLYDGGAEVAAESLTVTGYYIRPDGGTLLISGSQSGNMVYVDLPQNCYTYDGAFTLSLKISGGSAVQTLVIFDGRISLTTTDTIIDNERIIPSIEEIRAQMDAMERAEREAIAARDAANTAAHHANSAASTANTAAQTAATAAGNASSKADAANAAAEAANTAAAAANTAAASIDGLTVSAAGLAEGEAPTAAVSEVDGHRHIALGIPRGQTGAKGDTGATPRITIGTVTTGAPGTRAAASFTGTAENPVLSLTIPQGQPGTGNGTVTRVSGIAPDEAGNVALHAADIGAYAAGGIRTAALNLPVSAWTGSGPYTATISREDVTANTWVHLELDAASMDSYAADIDWSTDTPGQIVLTTAVMPSGALAGTLLLMEVN